MRRLISFLSGIVMGALVGGVVAILLAPASGDELREQMRARLSEMRDELSEAASMRRIELEKQLASLRQPSSIPAEKSEP